MELELLPIEFSVCKVSDYSGVDPETPFTFICRTDSERSLVCPTAYVPSEAVERVDGWRAIRITGQLDFSLVGILQGVLSVLSGKGIPVFAVSTFDTDYFLVRSEHLEPSVSALESAGYRVLRPARDRTDYLDRVS